MAGSSNVSGQESILFADNLSLDGSEREGKLATDGQLWIGRTIVNPLGTHISVGNIVAGSAAVTVSYSAPNIVIDLAGSSAAVETLTGNSGGAVVPTANNINVVTANSTVKFVGSSPTLTQDFNLDNLVLGSSLPANAGMLHNVGVGSAALNAGTTAAGDVAIGYLALTTATTAGGVTAVGFQAGTGITTGGRNTLIGYNAGRLITTSTENVALGTEALQLHQTAAANLGANTALGSTALAGVSTGSKNIGIGYAAGINYVSAESSNIAIGNTGTVTESNVIRIGTQGTSLGQQSQTYLAGVFNTQSGWVCKITTPGAYPYTTLITDDVILVDTSSARTIIPLASPVTGTRYVIKDSVGSAAANNITVTPSGKNIDGAASSTINVAYGSVTIVYNGTQWSII